MRRWKWLDRTPQQRVHAHHPDPAIELRLEVIRGLQRRVLAKEHLVDDFRKEIKELHVEVRGLRERGYNQTAFSNAADRHVKHITELQGEIRQLDADIDALNVQIGERSAALSEADLLFL